MVATAFSEEVVAPPEGATQPRPLHVVVIEGDSPDGPTTTAVRIWTAVDADACRLCLSCTAEDGPPAVDREGRPTTLRICSHSCLGQLDDESAAFFSPDGL